MSVEIKDHTAEVKKALKQQVLLGLEAIGAQAQNHAVRDCPVDTGRLQNSITWAVKGKQGPANTGKKGHAEPQDYAKQAEPEECTLYIGTNVAYAQKQEYGDTIQHKTGKAHFLRDSIAQHGNDYKDTLQKALQGKSN